MNIIVHWQHGGLLYCEERSPRPHCEGRLGDRVHACPVCFHRDAQPHPLSTSASEAKR